MELELVEGVLDAAQSALTVYDEYDPEQRTARTALVQGRRIAARSYIVRALPYGDYKEWGLQAAVDVTDGLDECSWDEGTVTLETGSNCFVFEQIDYCICEAACIQPLKSPPPEDKIVHSTRSR